MRKEVIARRNAMDPLARQEKSKLICEKAFDVICSKTKLDKADVEKDDAPLVALFSSFGSEVCLGDLEQRLLERSFRLCYPGMVKVDGSDRPKMMFFELDPLQARDKTALFLTKPAKAFPLGEIVGQGARLVGFDEVDLAVIPLVAFDETGARLGYGGGNYDEFLSEVGNGVPTIGVGFSEQLVERVPLEAHDLSLSCIISG